MFKVSNKIMSVEATLVSLLIILMIFRSLSFIYSMISKYTQLPFTYSKLTIETLEKGVK